VSFSANDRLRRSWPSWVLGDPSREHARCQGAFVGVDSQGAAGVEVVVAQNGQPVAMIVPWEPDRPVRVPGAWAGLVGGSEDAVESDDDVVALSDDSAAGGLVKILVDSHARQRYSFGTPCQTPRGGPLPSWGLAVLRRVDWSQYG